MWISDLNTTVCRGLRCPEAVLVAGFGLLGWRWFTEVGAGGIVVHGSHPSSA